MLNIIVIIDRIMNIKYSILIYVVVQLILTYEITKSIVLVSPLDNDNDNTEISIFNFNNNLGNYLIV